jgi:hypothetical protein
MLLALAIGGFLGILGVLIYKFCTTPDPRDPKLRIPRVRTDS